MDREIFKLALKVYLRPQLSVSFQEHHLRVLLTYVEQVVQVAFADLYKQCLPRTRVDTLAGFKRCHISGYESNLIHLLEEIKLVEQLKSAWIESACSAVCRLRFFGVPLYQADGQEIVAFLLLASRRTCNESLHVHPLQYAPQ